MLLRHGGSPSSVDQAMGFLDRLEAVAPEVADLPEVRNARGRADVVAKLQASRGSTLAAFRISVDMGRADQGGLRADIGKAGKRLALGSLAPSKVAEAVHAIEFAYSVSPDVRTISAVFDSAIAYSENACYSYLRTVGNDWIYDYLKPRVDTLAEKLAKLAPQLPPVEVHGSPGTQHLTTDMSERSRVLAEAEPLVDALNALWGLAGELMYAGLIPLPAGRSLDLEEFCWAGGIFPQYTDVPGLLGAINSGARPTLLTPSDLRLTAGPNTGVVHPLETPADKAWKAQGSGRGTIAWPVA